MHRIAQKVQHDLQPQISAILIKILNYKNRLASSSKFIRTFEIVAITEIHLNFATRMPGLLSTGHPAPFPESPHYPDTYGTAAPPKPLLKGSMYKNGGIVLLWNMTLSRHHASISNYQLFAYKKMRGPVDASLWRKVGDVDALPLPMACTLTQFADKHRYYFAIRAVDIHKRCGPFSDPFSIVYDKNHQPSKN